VTITISEILNVLFVSVRARNTFKDSNTIEKAKHKHAVYHF